MASLRRRFLSSTGLIVALQAAGTLLAVVSGRSVVQAVEAEQRITEEQAAFAALADAVREQYVHQAHTFIEGTAAHLGHHGEIEAEVEARLAAVQAIAGTAGLEVQVGAVADATHTLQAFFRETVAPRAEAGTLDRPLAALLHAQTEHLAGAVAAEIDAVVDQLHRAQADARAQAVAAARRAALAGLVLTLGGLFWTLAVARRLTRAVAGPVERLVSATERFGAGAAVAPLQVEGDDEIRALGAAFNRMTAEVHAAQERRVQAERLAALGEMSAAIAHELLNPLAVLLGDPALRTPEAAAAREEAEHARRIVQGLRGFARPGEEAPAPVDLLVLAVASADRLLATADGRGVSIAVRGEAVRTTLSPSAARQVIDNLVRNAVEASPEGGEVEIAVGPGARIRVMDRGPGLPEAVRARLYEPFVTGRSDGVGLGLAICARIVRAQGGKLRHEDREGGGTCAVWAVGG